MAVPRSVLRPIRGLAHCRHGEMLTMQFASKCVSRRSMTTTAPVPDPIEQDRLHANFVYSTQPPAHLQRPSVTTTLYSFPDMEPLRFVEYPSNHLYLPLRRDILHRAVIYEGDMTRQGNASTKWRLEVHGSSRKLYPQKGMGKARVGDKKSPIRRGGGVAFGPKPRDFSTGLQKKVYDLAWRTALSYRYRKGELILVEDGVDLKEGSAEGVVEKIFGGASEWTRGRGQSLIITNDYRENLAKALDHGGKHALALPAEDIDVKDLLKQGRIIVEKSALDWLLSQHRSDITVPKAKQILTSLEKAASELHI